MEKYNKYDSDLKEKLKQKEYNKLTKNKNYVNMKETLHYKKGGK